VNIGLLPLLNSNPVVFVLLVSALIEAIALHEFAHALAADLQGDRLPRAEGRVTLNPIRHLDPIGTLCLVLVGFGWGKPVEFRPAALSSRRFGAAIVALAGPGMNLALALMGALLVRVLVPGGCAGLGTQVSFGTSALAGQFLLVFISINLLLAVFNLIPLPPLDGSRLLTIFLPPRHQHFVFWLDRYGFLVLLGLVFFGQSLIFSLITAVTGPILGWVC
jgi:Zn-dependent protease